MIPPSQKVDAKAECAAKGGRLRPDGFGGKECVEPVKSIPDRVFSGDSPPPPPPPPPPAAAPKKSVGESTSSSSSSAALSLDDLIKNSITQKETLLGRPLSDAEKDALTAKVKALFGS